MTLVPDASVVAKWALDEDGSDRANALRDEDRLIAPSLLAAELGSALWKAVRRRSVSRTDALAALPATLLAFDTLVPMDELHERALEMAMELDHPIYDCFYLALAERDAAQLVTADERMFSAAKKAKVKARML